MQHYNIAAISVKTGQRLVIPLNRTLPREEVQKQVTQSSKIAAQHNLSWHYALTTEKRAVK